MPYQQVATSISSLHPELTVTTDQTRLNQLQTLQTTYNTELASAQSANSQTYSTAVEEISRSGCSNKLDSVICNALYCQGKN